MAPAWLPQVTLCGQHNLLNADEPVSHACFWRYLGCEHDEGQACLGLRRAREDHAPGDVRAPYRSGVAVVTSVRGIALRQVFVVGLGIELTRACSGSFQLEGQVVQLDHVLDRHLPALLRSALGEDLIQDTL